MNETIERAIKTMWERYDEPLTLAELADSAILSRFYFSRVFRAVTGTSPGRFLSAIRLCRAKNLLLETSLSVTEISYLVGYNSLGTFTSRFTRSVCMSPSRYRHLSQVGIEAPIPSVPPAGARENASAVYGRLNVPEADALIRVYVATFNSSIPEGVPASCVVVDAEGQYRLDTVPMGDWYIHAAAVAVKDVDPCPWLRRPLFVHTGMPVRVPFDSTIRVDITLRPLQPIDLPVLVALPELDNREVPATVPCLRTVEDSRRHNRQHAVIP